MAMKHEKDIIIHTGSAYVWEFFHVIRNRFSLFGFHQFENSDLLSKMIHRVCFQLEADRRVFIIKVRGHEGNPHNDTSDWLAKKASQQSDGNASFFFRGLEEKSCSKRRNMTPLNTDKKFKSLQKRTLPVFAFTQVRAEEETPYMVSYGKV